MAINLKKGQGINLAKSENDLSQVTIGLGWDIAQPKGMLSKMFGKQEEYVGAVPAVAILPFFLAGALFPISAMPAWLTTVAKFLPLTHALALMRYAIVDRSGNGLHDIWGMSNVTAEAWLSLAVVALFAVALTAISIRVFSRSAVS